MILLAIHPHYAEAILDGRNGVEFRKRGFRRSISHIVIYSTQPVARITGACAVAGIDIDAPDRLWARYAHVSGMTRDAFSDYYASSTVGVGIRIAEARRLPHPLQLTHLGPDVHPPQSFAYLSAEQVGRALGSSDVVLPAETDQRDLVLALQGAEAAAGG